MNPPAPERSSTDPHPEIPPDILAPGLSVVFVGSAKSVASAQAGHYYAHPSNGFWKLLHLTGFTDRALAPSEDRSVLRHGIGLTDVVPGRAESNDSNLGDDDFDLPGFVAKMELYRPRIIAFNGGTSATRVASHLGHSRPAIGPLPWTLAGAGTYRLPSSSSRNAAGGFELKLAAWAEFGAWSDRLFEDRPHEPAPVSD